MSYTPTEWKDNDEVTSTLLNNLESGVTAVGYTPTTWSAGDVVTAEKLNKLEQGVADSSEMLALYMSRKITSFTLTKDMFEAQDPDDEWWEGEDPDEDDFFQVRFIGQRAITFNDCTKLSKINGLDLVYGIGVGAFKFCESLTELYLPNAELIGSSNPYSNGSVIDSSAIEKISAPKVTEVGISALSGGNYLQYCYLPKVTKISSGAFGYDPLEHIYIGADCTSIASNAFGNVTSNVIIDCGFAENAVSGAPWGATNATINYNVTDPESIEAMIEGGNS